MTDYVLNLGIYSWHLSFCFQHSVTGSDLYIGTPTAVNLPWTNSMTLRRYSDVVGWYRCCCSGRYCCCCYGVVCLFAYIYLGSTPRLPLFCYPFKIHSIWCCCLTRTATCYCYHEQLFQNDIVVRWWTFTRRWPRTNRDDILLFIDWTLTCRWWLHDFFWLRVVVSVVDLTLLLNCLFCCGDATNCLCIYEYPLNNSDYLFSPCSGEYLVFILFRWWHCYSVMTHGDPAYHTAISVLIAMLIHSTGATLQFDYEHLLFLLLMLLHCFVPDALFVHAIHRTPCCWTFDADVLLTCYTWANTATLRRLPNRGRYPTNTNYIC